LKVRVLHGPLKSPAQTGFSFWVGRASAATSAALTTAIRA
jgi:hypothetical protein